MALSPMPSPEQRSDVKRVRQAACFVLLMLLLYTIFGVVALRYTINYVERLTSAAPTILDSPTSSKCSYPIVYNKPHKTASTRIQTDILRWASRAKRPAYRCSPFINQATIEMRECVPEDLSGCAVLATHIILSPVMRQIIENKIGSFRLVTSTRDPSARVLSSYLQQQRIKGSSDIDVEDLQKFLRTHNPWKLYNYHTGSNRRGICPLSADEKALLPDLVNQADIVVDADLRNVSNAILESNALFKISAQKANVRSSKDVVLDEKTKWLLKNITCVEVEIHRLYRLRMASLYEKATGKECLSDKRNPSPCF